MDRTAGGGGGRQAATGPTSRQGDHPHTGPPPRPQAVAGKKCGAWPTSMKTTSPRWRTCWRRMNSPTIPSNRWSAWTKSQSRCTPISVPRRQPGRGGKRDAIASSERCGTANVFCAVEPKAGRHFTFPTPDRSGFEFAQVIVTLALEYQKAETIHLVMDNLNIHSRKSLADVFGAEMAAEVWDRFTIHHTPTHGSWLNQAEIEIGIFARQCLGSRRIPDLKTLRREAKAWNRRMNCDCVRIAWKFDRRAARRKFGYKR